MRTRNFGPKPLTSREKQIVSMVRHRMENREIAAALDLSLYTIKYYVQCALVKTGMSTRAELILRFEQLDHQAELFLLREKHEQEIAELQRKIASLENQLLWGGWNG